MAADETRNEQKHGGFTESFNGDRGQTSHGPPGEGGWRAGRTHHPVPFGDFSSFSSSLFSRFSFLLSSLFLPSFLPSCLFFKKNLILVKCT